MLAIPGSGRATRRLPSRRLPSRRLPMLRRRSAREQAMETLRGGLDQGLRALGDTFQEARDAAIEARLPEAVGASVRGLAAGMPKLPDGMPKLAVEMPKLAVVSSLAGDLHPPELRLRDATRHLRVDRLRTPNVGTPDVRLDAHGLRELGRRAGTARDFVGSLPEYRLRRESRSAPTGAILGAVLLGMIGGLWLATWPATAPRVRAFFESLRSRLGLNGGWSAGAARDALDRVDARAGGWRDGPLARRRRRQPTPARDLEPTGWVAGVAVGPGHVSGPDLGAPVSDDVAIGSGSTLAGWTGSAGSPPDERVLEHDIYRDPGPAPMPGDMTEPG